MSLELRLILMAILIAALVAYRSGFFKKLKEKRGQREAEEKQKLRREQKRARIQEAKRREELQRQKTVELLKRASPGLLQRSAMVGGQEIWYLEGGARGELPSVVLLHGFAGDKETWAPVAARLARRQWHVVVPDLPGFGQNSKDDKPSYDVTTQAKRVRAFARKIGLDRVHLVGCSMGATIAATCAYGAADEVASLVLVEPFGLRLPYQSELDEMLAEDRNPLIIANPQAYDNLLSYLYAEPPELAPGLAQYRAAVAAANRVLYLKIWKETREGDRANLLDLLLPELKVRTLLLLGSKSRLVHGATADAIRAMRPGSTSLVIDGCGHFLMEERPEEAEKHIARFLTAVSGVPADPPAGPPADAAAGRPAGA
jgi:pimeloyl-ACP methyl ester carboxylesterase